MSNDDDIKALKGVARMLLSQLRSITAEAHAIRVMLHQRGLYDNDEYERLHAEALSQFDQSLNDLLNEAMSKANAEAARRLLENFEGTPQ